MILSRILNYYFKTSCYQVGFDVYKNAKLGPVSFKIRACLFFELRVSINKMIFFFLLGKLAGNEVISITIKQLLTGALFSNQKAREIFQ